MALRSRRYKQAHKVVAQACPCNARVKSVGQPGNENGPNQDTLGGRSTAQGGSSLLLFGRAGWSAVIMHDWVAG